MRKRNIYSSREEKAMLDKKVKKTGLTTSSLLRMLITDYEPKEKNYKSFMIQLYHKSW